MWLFSCLQSQWWIWKNIVLVKGKTCETKVVWTKICRHYHVTAGDIMVTNVIYISTKSTYMQLRELLRKAKLTSFALVDSPGKFVFLFLPSTIKTGHFLITTVFCCWPSSWFCMMGNIYVLKFNRNTRKRCEKRQQWRRSGVFIVNFEHLAHLFSMFLLPTLHDELTRGKLFEGASINLRTGGLVLEVQFYPNGIFDWQNVW